MAKNKHVDLFKDMIPAVDMGIKELWDAATEEGRKEIKGDFFTLNRYISNVKGGTREEQEYFVLSVNEYYNKNWAAIQAHPKLVWQTLTLCHHPSKKNLLSRMDTIKERSKQKSKVPGRPLS
jgi:hypothetical protein